MSLEKRFIENFLLRNGFDTNDINKSRESIDALRARFNKMKKQAKAMNDFQDQDEIHISTMVMAEEIQMLAFVDVITKGTMITIDKDQKVKQKNHSISTFYQMSKILMDESKKLGFSALDRKELKLETEEGDELPEGTKQ